MHFVGEVPYVCEVFYYSDEQLAPYIRKPSDHNYAAELQTDAAMVAKQRKLSCDPVDFKVKYKTELCKYWKLGKECPYVDQCAFAHGYEEIRQKTHIPFNYKTKKCKNFHELGYCPYGERCQFRHSEYSDYTRAVPLSENATTITSPSTNTLATQAKSKTEVETSSYQELLQHIDQYIDEKSKAVVIYTPQKNRSRLPTLENLTASTCSPYSDKALSDISISEITHLQI